MSTYTVGSLFTGVGMADLGFAAAGYQIKFQVEVDEFCQKVLHARANFFNYADVHGDIRDCGIGRKHELPYVDVLVGGFPCQDISLAGDRAGLAEGTRSGLWYEFRRVIDEVRPRVVVIENVSAILTAVKRQRLYPEGGKHGITRICRRTRRQVPAALIVIEELAKMGYVGSWGIISAADTGSPHKRDRWWVVGYANSERHSQPSTIQNGGGNIEWNLPTRQSTGRTILHAPESDGKDMGNSTGAGLENRKQADGWTDAAQITSGLESKLERPDESVGNTFSLNVQGQRDVRNGIASTRPGTGQSQRTGYRARQRRNIPQSRLGGTADGFTYRVDKPLYPAAPGDFQYPYEPQRTVGAGEAHRTPRLKALGNGLMPQIAYALAMNIREVLA